MVYDPRLSESDDPTYRDQVAPITGDKTRRVIPVQNLRAVAGGAIALDVAQTDKDYRIHGDFLYADPSSTGIVTVKLNSSAEPGFQMSSQAAIVGIPMKDIFVSWTGQAGKSILLFYGYGARFQPPQQSIASIGSILNTVTVQSGGQPYGAKYSSTAAIAAAGTENVFLAASNVNGAIIHAGGGISNNATGLTMTNAYHAHTVAPAAFTDGDIVVHFKDINAVGAAFQAAAELKNPLLLAAAKGVWYRNGGAIETVAGRSLLYTLK